MLRPATDGDGALGTIRDMTKFDQAQRHLLRLDRTLRAITNCNQILVRATTEDHLLRQVCQAIFDAGGYRLVWFGFAENDARKSVRVAASAGHDRGYLTALDLSWSDRAVGGSGPTGRAIRTGQMQLVRSIASDPAFQPWRGEALRRGYCASVAFPVTIDGGVAGVLNLYCDAAEALDTDELKLLAELAADLGYGLTTLRTRAALALQQDALRRSEQRYRSLFEKNLGGLYQTTLDGQIVDCNDAFVRMFGYESRDEMRVLGADKLYQEPAVRDAFLKRLTKDGTVRNHECRGRRKDGTAVVFLETACIVDGDFIEGTVLDVTERRMLEERLRQSQKMEAIGRLAGGVAHDFNNLLSVILGYGESLRKELAAEPLRAKTEQVMKAALRGADLTRQLLAFSRQQILRPDVLNLNTVVSGMLEMLRRLIGEDVELVTVLEPHAGNVSADKGQVEQVIMNLVVNARDAMPEGGRIIVETCNVDLTSQYLVQHAQRSQARPGPYVQLTVSDTGSGIDPETQASIFEPFFTTKGLGRGTGLGLSTAYGIVKQSDGFIWVYSEVGVGTTFRIYWPRVDRAASSPKAPECEPLRRGRGTILLVEDEPALRDLLAEVLGEAGYGVLTAPDGAQAVQVANAHNGTIELLLSDFVLPGITGHVAADQITAGRPAMKVLFMSGYSDEVARRRGLPERGAAFVSKPFTPDTLLREIQRILHLEELGVGAALAGDCPARDRGDGASDVRPREGGDDGRPATPSG